MVVGIIIIVFINAVIGASIYNSLIDKGYTTGFCVFMGVLGLLFGALMIRFAWILPDVNLKLNKDKYHIIDWNCPKCGKSNSALLRSCECGYVKIEQEEQAVQEENYKIE